VWRRKCGIIQDKYQSLRSLFDKDKFIGLPMREEENNINHQNGNVIHKDYRKPYNSGANSNPNLNRSMNQNSNMLEELNSMAEKFKAGLKVTKKPMNYA